MINDLFTVALDLRPVAAAAVPAADSTTAEQLASSLTSATEGWILTTPHPLAFVILAAAIAAARTNRQPALAAPPVLR